MNRKIAKDLYRNMLRIRMVEEKIAALYSEQEMRCPVHLSIGQEAPAVGVCAHLSKDDIVMSAHRAHAHYLAKGGSLKAMIAELYGKETGCAMGKGGSMHLVDLKAGFYAAVPIVGSTIPIATGVAWGFKMKKQDNITAVFLGDGATEEGVFFESLDFANLKSIPILFVCENNFYSVYSNLRVRQAKNRDISKLAESHGIKSYKGNGNDINQVYSLADKAIKYIKKTKGPAFVELETFRWLEHCGPNWDDSIGYRENGELLKWMDLCPIKGLEKNILESGIMQSEDISIIKNKITKEIDKAFDYANKSSFPKISMMNEHIYKD
jgi:TPP-dependent pyruvate/acetoin dehydrogenase alpha subunit